MADPCVTFADPIYKFQQVRNTIIKGQIGGKDQGKATRDEAEYYNYGSSN